MGHRPLGFVLASAFIHTACAPPADLTCGESLVAFSSNFAMESGSTPVTIATAEVVDAEAVVTLAHGEGRNSSIRFSVDEAAPPALPPLGDAVLNSLDEACSGEPPCGASFWILRDALNESSFLELGHVSQIDDGGVVPAIENVTLQPDPVDGRCGSAPLGARAVLATDDGDIQLEPGARVEVRLGGAPWHAIGGLMSRTARVQDSGPCGDCPTPGTHLTYRAEVVLYPR